MKALLQGKEIVQMPGAHDQLTGLMAKKTGFKALYISGAAFSASRGMPDIGYFTVTELADYVRGLYQATNLPILVDVDTGFGEVVHLPRTVLEMEGAGAAMIQMEDQKLPKNAATSKAKNLSQAMKCAVKSRRSQRPARTSCCSRAPMRMRCSASKKRSSAQRCMSMPAPTRFP